MARNPSSVTTPIATAVLPFSTSLPITRKGTKTSGHTYVATAIANSCDQVLSMLTSRSIAMTASNTSSELASILNTSKRSFTPMPLSDIWAECTSISTMVTSASCPNRVSWTPILAVTTRETAKEPQRVSSLHRAIWASASISMIINNSSQLINCNYSLSMIFCKKDPRWLIFWRQAPTTYKGSVPARLTQTLTF